MGAPPRPRDAPRRPARTVADENLLEAFRTVVRALPEGRIEEDRDAVRAYSGLPGNAFNVVFATARPDDPTAWVARARSFMREAGTSAWRAVLWPRTEPALAPALRAAGLVRAAPIPAMVLDPVPRRARPLPAGGAIVAVDTERRWREYLRAGTLGFGGGPGPGPLDGIPWRPDAPWRGFLGLHRGRPVATSLAVPTPGVSGVYLVTTLPAFRGRGFGAALTMAAARAFRGEGADRSILQSTVMGFPVYRALGYRVVARYGMWYVPGPSPRAGGTRR
jgi:GNAT superfamily N-acetyltransferase